MRSRVRERRISIPRLLEVRSGCLDDIATLLRIAQFDTTRVYVGSGHGPTMQIAERVTESLRRADLAIVRRHAIGGTLRQAAQLAAQIIEDEVSLVIAVGGGKVIDTMKLASARSGVEFVSCPTTIAHDGISSPVASLLPAGSGRRSFAAAMPAGVLVDVEVIGRAPPRTLRAGIGDLLSNLTAILDWQLADERGEEHFDAFSAMIAENAARSILEIEDLASAETHAVLAKGLLLSGLAMAVAGTSRPCSGAEHLISHSLDELLGHDATALHGEQVALGTLVSAAAHRSALLPELRAVFARVGLPTAPAALGLDMRTMVEAVVAAPATRPHRYTVLSQFEPSVLVELVSAAFPDPEDG